MKHIRLSSLLSEAIHKLQEETPQAAQAAGQWDYEKGTTNYDKNNPGNTFKQPPLSPSQQATAQAKELGLVSRGWGRWADPSDMSKIVAKTVDGHLVKVEPDFDGTDPDREMSADEDEQHYNSSRMPWPRTPEQREAIWAKMQQARMQQK